MSHLLVESTLLPFGLLIVLISKQLFTFAELNREQNKLNLK
jgi:hypothetical protein